MLQSAAAGRQNSRFISHCTTEGALDSLTGGETMDGRPAACAGTPNQALPKREGKAGDGVEPHRTNTAGGGCGPGPVDRSLPSFQIRERLIGSSRTSGTVAAIKRIRVCANERGHVTQCVLEVALNTPRSLWGLYDIRKWVNVFLIRLPGAETGSSLRVSQLPVRTS